MTEGMEAGMCTCDYEPFDWYSMKEVKARKEHQCCECSEPIVPGQTYENATGSYCGTICHYKSCLPCGRIRRDFCCAYEGLREMFWEVLGFDYVTGESRFDDDEEDDDG